MNDTKVAGISAMFAKPLATDDPLYQQVLTAITMLQAVVSMELVYANKSAD